MTTPKDLKPKADTKRYPLRNKTTKLFVPNVKKMKSAIAALTKRKLIKKAPKTARKAPPPPKNNKNKIQATKVSKKPKDTSKLYDRFSAPTKLMAKLVIHQEKKHPNGTGVKQNSKPKGVKMRMSIRIKQGKELERLKKEGIIQEGRMRSYTKTKEYILKHFNIKPKQRRIRTDIPLSTNKSKNKSKSVPRIKPSSKEPVIRVIPPKRRVARRSNSPMNSKRMDKPVELVAPRIRVRKPIQIIPVLPEMRRRIKKVLASSSNGAPIDEAATNNVMASPFEESRSAQIQGRIKTLAELERINRSRQQRIFLLSAQRGETGEWTFKVIGTQGQIYTVHVFTVARCTCFDYRSKRQPCKHIFFIITQIAQNESILQDFTEQGSITESCFDELNECLLRRLRARIEGVKQVVQEGKEIDLKDDKDCVICFTEMDQKEEQLDSCETCKKYFHLQCLKSWRSHNNSCPLCRSEFETIKVEVDPLEKFEELRI